VQKVGAGRTRHGGAAGRRPERSLRWVAGARTPERSRLWGETVRPQFAHEVVEGGREATVCARVAAVQQVHGHRTAGSNTPK